MNLRTRLKKTFSKKKNQRRAFYILTILIILALMGSVAAQQRAINNRNKYINKTTSELLKLNRSLQDATKLKAGTDAELKAKADAEVQLKRQIDNLNSQLQAKAELKEQQSIASRVINTVTFTAPVQAATCGDNQFANFIYMHESGCDVTRVNSIGCRGIGQACPGDKLPCGADYACQNAFFTSYALQRYGSWANAYAFWLVNKWW